MAAVQAGKEKVMDDLKGKVALTAESLRR